MPHSTARQQPATRQPSGRIKQDPDNSAAASSTRRSAAAPNGHSGHGITASASDHENENENENENESTSSSHIPVDQSFVYRQGRSDAPPPSDLSTELPLLREMRVRMDDVASPPNHEESFLTTSFQDIGKKLKACNDTLGELQQLGVSHKVPLPELVLVGDQSAGKSSLMSGLANLELPRNDGTCTRCPLHIRVSRNNDWSCRVWLQKEYSYEPPEGRPITKKDVTEHDPFFPWKKVSSNTNQTLEFKVMHDKSEIENVLRWAQIAILNDHQPHELFIPGSGAIAMHQMVDEAAESTRAKFSPNIVALEIKGPDLPDLSFYDMPGIFQNAGDVRDGYLVEVVRNLSREYMMHETAIVLVSMAMNSDADLSSTFALAQELRIESRTIGVLTKADLLPNSNPVQWMRILNGERHKTDFGYFVTSRPQDQTLDELKTWERLMFDEFTFPTWPQEFHQFADRCGVEKLKAFLSEKLGAEFRKSLPQIKQLVKTHLQRNAEKLASLPEMPTNVEHEVRTCLRDFVDNSREKLNELTRQFGPLPRGFQRCLLGGFRPKFRLEDPSDYSGRTLGPDEDLEIIRSQSTPQKRRYETPGPSSVKRSRRDLSPADSRSFNGSANGEDGHPRTVVSRPLFDPFERFASFGSGFGNLQSVREEIQMFTKAGMPQCVPHEVYESLSLRALRRWDEPMRVLLETTMDMVRDRLNLALNESFDKLKKRLIYERTWDLILSLLSHLQEKEEAALTLVHKGEARSLLTFDEASFERYRQEELARLQHFRHDKRVRSGWESAGIDRPDDSTFVPWENLSEEKKQAALQKRTEQLRRLGPDRFARELEVMAYIRGYYRLAAVRFTDNVAQRIICHLIPQIQRELNTEDLCMKLGLAGPEAEEVYEALMSEDRVIAVNRKTYRDEKEKFKRALQSIERLEESTRDVDFSVPSVIDVETIFDDDDDTMMTGEA